ncbi:MAG: glycosyltransferase family 9 protein [Planctomycetota bacterium]|nr:glycosyltransferase family 9 protein [Planctomycetota bacterium]
MNLHGRDAWLIRPGALGDAVLTLPAVETLLGAGARRVTVLGTPGSWAWLPPDEPRVAVRDFGAPEWAALAAPGLELPPRARAALAGVALAVCYLKTGGAHAVRILEEAGAAHAVAAEPPLAAGPEPIHASHILLRPLLDAGLKATASAPLTLGPTPPARNQEPPCLALHPGSGGRRKCWPAERYAELARRAAERFKLRALLLAGPADEAARAAFGEAAHGVAYETLLERPLREVAARLANCRAFVGNDAGVTHLAARFCPTLALFGPTDPRVWRPLGPRVEVVRSMAPDGAMDGLAADAVLDALGRLLAQ